jgi:hypothetical protein
MHSARLKEEKAAKGRKASAAKGRSTVKMDLDRDILGGEGGFDEMDDFM